jgi:hypothetical protein
VVERERGLAPDRDEVVRPDDRERELVVLLRARVGEDVRVAIVAAA